MNGPTNLLTFKEIRKPGNPIVKEKLIGKYC